MKNAPDSSAGPTRIFIVDDHPFFCDGLAAWIARQDGLAVCGRSDAADAAVAFIAAEKPEIVLLDLHLKSSDGFDVLHRVMRDGHPTRVIVLSHKDGYEYAERAIRSGARGYVLKDEAADALMIAIRTVLDGGIHVSPALQRSRLRRPDRAAGAPLERLESLSHRELQVMRLLGQGRSTKQIAHDLGISPKTVEFYRESLKGKLRLPDSLMLVRLATIWEYEGRFEPWAARRDEGDGAAPPPP